MNDIPPLRGVECRNCSECRGRGTVRNRTCPMCMGRRVVITQHGRPVKLESAPEIIDTHTAIRAERRANVQCLNCGSPQLESETLCATCLAKMNESTRESNRRVRGRSREEHEEIG